MTAWMMHHKDAKTRRRLRASSLRVSGLGAAAAQRGSYLTSYRLWCTLGPNVRHFFVPLWLMVDQARRMFTRYSTNRRAIPAQTT